MEIYDFRVLIARLSNEYSRQMLSISRFIDVTGPFNRRQDISYNASDVERALGLCPEN